VRLLLIDDDEELLASLAQVLRGTGNDVVTANTGGRGLALTTEQAFDAILCDINLPDLDGFSVCRQLRSAGATIPIVLLSSRDGEIDQALGLDLGADDYVTKPFSTRILLARLGALARRTRAQSGDVVRAGELAIDRARLEISFEGMPIATTLTELRMLAALAEHPGTVLSRERLLQLGREDDSVVAPRIVDTYIARLRRKLDEVRAGAGASIETVIGAGYRWRTT
jgi:two-component system OmpR family response regulator/two-component system response regulator ChvI